MFFRMLVRAALLRPGRSLAALLAMVVAATAATAMLNLFVDVQSKLQKEFRKYGANIVLIPKEGQALPLDTLSKADDVLAGNGVAVPFAYAVARTASGDPVLVSGTDLNNVRRIDSWWSVTSWPEAPHDALLGVHAASAVSEQGKPFELTYQGRTLRLNPRGTLHTGAEEDSTIYLFLNDFESWTGVESSIVEIAASGSAADIDTTFRRLKQALPDVEVRPVRQIMEGEARVLGKTRATLLAASILIIVTATLCVLATLTGWVLDRRRDFAIMKALGASQRFIITFFAAEAAILGSLGAILGFCFGVGIAAWIGRANFHAPVMPRFEVFPVVLAGCIVIALISCIVPISLLRRLQPAMILKGE